MLELYLPIFRMVRKWTTLNHQFWWVIRANRSKYPHKTQAEEREREGESQYIYNIYNIIYIYIIYIQIPPVYTIVYNVLILDGYVISIETANHWALGHPGSGSRWALELRKTPRRVDGRSKMGKTWEKRSFNRFEAGGFGVIFCELSFARGQMPFFGLWGRTSVVFEYILDGQKFEHRHQEPKSMSLRWDSTSGSATKS